MNLRKAFVTCLCLSVAIPPAQCGTVLSVLMPGPLSHLFNMKKIAEAVSARGHDVKVKLVAADGSMPTHGRSSRETCANTE